MSQPTTAIAGDSITWTESTPAGTNPRARVVFQHLKTGFIITATGAVEGDLWRYTVSPQDSANAPGGNYASAIIIEDDDDGRQTTVRSALSLSEPLDRPLLESHARKMVGLLQRHLEGRIDDERGRGLEQYTIGGVPITKLSQVEAKDLLDRYRRDLAQEDQERRAQLGLGTGRRILTHFES